jgi:hypothetical protein
MAIIKILVILVGGAKVIDRFDWQGLVIILFHAFSLIPKSLIICMRCNQYS